jgi:C4-dicarboxylate-specific signal transduction histidine kinase
VKVLIVEDRPEDTELMVRELRKARLAVDWRAVSSESAYLETLAWEPDVILSDFHLPQFNAFMALSILRQRRIDVPLIVVTGSISEEIAVECIKRGAVDYLLKDRMARLPAAVTSAVDEKQLRDEKRRAEEQLQQRLAELAHVSRLATMGELVSELAHELNQPLYAISNFAWACLNLTRSSTVENLPELTVWLEQICEQSQRAGEIIRRVYGFVRKSPTQARFVDLRELVQDCTSLLQVNLRQQQVEISLDLAADVPPVSVDPVQIQQVLINLMNYAIDAMADLPKGERQLRVRLFRRANEEAEVQVMDCGCGAGEIDLEQLFEAFFTTKTEGMGMGLAISRSIVEAHGGRLWAERNQERGLTFRLALPLQPKEP